MNSRTWILIASIVSAAVTANGQSDDFGKWKSLFDGKSLDGWKSAEGENQWKVEDGALTNGKDGANNLRTDDEFGDYELEVAYKIPPRGNSGVYLRGQVEVQVFDSHGKEKLEKNDAGAIYNRFAPLKDASRPAGEWNRYRILHIGHHITVWLNDVLVQDNVWRDSPRERGPIQLQGDHTKVWYKDLRIRPLFGEGWKPLWNGKDFAEFTAGNGSRKVEDLWKVEDHSFTNQKWGGNGGHDIWTREPFGNFLVHYSYRSDPKVEGGNGGFYLRDQWEIQILDHPDTKEPHSDGSLYSIHAPAVAARNAPDQWNHMDVKVEGMKIWVWQNGKLIQDGKTCETRTDNHGVKTPKFSRAPFKLQGDHGKVWFTDLQIKPLPDGE
jgi:3-keto-disaccharide hydrolase